MGKSGPKNLGRYSQHIPYPVRGDLAGEWKGRSGLPHRSPRSERARGHFGQRCLGVAKAAPASEERPFPAGCHRPSAGPAAPTAEEQAPRRFPEPADTPRLRGGQARVPQPPPVRTAVRRPREPGGGEPVAARPAPAARPARAPTAGGGGPAGAEHHPRRRAEGGRRSRRGIAEPGAAGSRAPASTGPSSSQRPPPPGRPERARPAARSPHTPAAATPAAPPRPPPPPL
ncbi:basic salivary proline-rich protein 4-like [Neovison vison]|uniref:basic salivary proline-rich protein 4-like n=1 Tax=Neovison vison TaxID=452646 RepID=UPI001CF05062|nr:basic salivary proline-rich protein 4-like [Neogale vison]